VKLITIDFETYYSKTFSLSKMTTEEYIRSSEFEVVGVAVQEGEQSSVWFSGTRKNIKEFLDWFDWDNSAVIAHNAMFDLAILNWHFDINPKKIVDTLSMARAIHGTEVGGSLAALAVHYRLGTKGTDVLNALGKRRIDFTAQELTSYGEYCKNDAGLTYGLFWKLMDEGFPVSELNLIDLTMRMFVDPVIELDVDVLTGNLQAVQTIKAQLLHEAMTNKEQLMSNDRLAELLWELGVISPTKISPTTQKSVFAFARSDEEFQALLEHENFTVQALVAARLGVKSTIEETRTERLISIAGRGLMPIPLRYYAAHTGRWGGDDKVNMQNLPRKSPLKYALRAPKGYAFIDCDSSQIEARTLAWLSGQADLVQAFEKGEDVYRIMAASIYGKPQEDITKDERFVGKTTILGAGYGMGYVKFGAQLQTLGVVMDEKECERIVSVYRRTYTQIPKLWTQANHALLAMLGNKTTELGLEGVLAVEGKRGIRLPNGLYLKYPNLRWKTDASTGKNEMVYDVKKGKSVVVTRIYGGKLVENICQALARIIIGEQMLAVSKKQRVVMTVHDAIGCVVPEAEAQTGLEFVEACMRIRPTWAQGLPLNCEGGSGATYGDC
jgi:DNA polymerase